MSLPRAASQVVVSTWIEKCEHKVSLAAELVCATHCLEYGIGTFLNGQGSLGHADLMCNPVSGHRPGMSMTYLAFAKTVFRLTRKILPRVNVEDS